MRQSKRVFYTNFVESLLSYRLIAEYPKMGLPVNKKVRLWEKKRTVGLLWKKNNQTDHGEECRKGHSGALYGS